MKRTLKAIATAILLVSLATPSFGSPICEDIDAAGREDIWPIQVDEATLAINTSCKGEHVQTRYLITVPEVSQLIKRNAKVRERQRKDTCKSSSVRVLMKAGLRVSYEYLDEKSLETVLSFTCKPRSI